MDIYTPNSFLIFVFWVVFSVGFRVQPTNNVPFVVWLTAGMAAWFVFADIVNGSSHVIVANAHLIKKTLFPSQILPVVKIASCFITHSVFLLVLIGLIIFQKMSFSFYFLQFLYYLMCMSVLALGLGWAPKIQILFKLNPMFYIVQGYRESFIYFQPFWIHPRQTVYFWGVTVIIIGVGALIFQRLKPQFADVL